MTFKEVLAQVVAWLQQDKRVSYRALKRQFGLDDAALEDLQDAILYAYPQVSHDASRGLVWTPAAPAVPAEAAGRFDAVLAAVTALLRWEGRVTYRFLRLACGLDAALLEAVCRELTFKQLAYDAHGEGIVWNGEPYAALPPASPVIHQPEFPAATGLPATEFPVWSAQVLTPAVGLDVQDDGHVSAPVRTAPEAERRQLTVLFCDLVGSTQLSGQLDPEDLRAVVRAYQEAAAEVIQSYAGHIAQYLGDGLLVYFGYPTAHEDDARRAVHTGLGLIEAIATLNSRLTAQYRVQLAVRLGIHTGPVVVGVMGGGGRARADRGCCYPLDRAGLSTLGGRGMSMRGWVLAMQGQGEAGLAQVCQGITAWRATGAALYVPYLYTLLADVCAYLGHTADGLQALAEAHTLVEQQEERYWEAEVCRLQGVLLLRQPGTPQEEAEAWLQKALDVAHRQEAKSLELRAAVSLSRLWQQQGKQAEARALLAPVYGWFTEGFDTADLQEAKALLEGLA